MKNIFLLTLIIFVFSSCGKTKEVKIIAKNAATGLPYAGLEYVVVSSRTTANGEKYRTEASGTLNSNGEAMVSIKQKSGRTYSIRVVEPDNTCYNKQITQFFDSPFDVNGTFTFEFAECAFLKFNINNINCQGPSDNFKLFYFGRQVGGQGPNLIGALSIEGNGCYNFLSTDFSQVPEGEMYWKWEVTRLGVTTTYFDTLFFLPSEQKTFTIDY
ncbi:hypothetical protein [Flavobacterium sp.]|uniref:hypothetical protein n=1 Tax=Flavobacterium sp. TaxID=239 RepID=UPI00286E313D|nr:hypothetical protein [Flavobacterium sp.]